MPGIRTPTYLWRDTIQIPNSRCGALTEDAGVDSADAGANRMIFVLRYVAQATFLLKYGITVTELHAFVTYFYAYSAPLFLCSSGFIGSVLGQCLRECCCGESLGCPVYYTWAVRLNSISDILCGHR